MTEFDRGQSQNQEMVIFTDSSSGEEYSIPQWSIPLTEKMSPEEVSIIAGIFVSIDDYHNALAAACADARLGINLPVRLSEPTPIDAPHYRMQEVLHQTLPIVRARLAKERESPDAHTAW